MADDSKSSNLGGNNFIWLLLAAATTYFVVHQVPLEGSRPAATERSLRERVGEQHIDARLWQDPFAAVAETLAKSPELNPENCGSAETKYKHVQDYCWPPWQKIDSGTGQREPEPTLALVVSVSGAPYSEDQESRRRTRYAVLAGLAAEGFIPQDPKHIGFYWPGAARSFQRAPVAVGVQSQPQSPAGAPLQRARLAATATSQTQSPGADSPQDSRSAVETAASSHRQSSAASQNDPVPEAVPFEWLEPRLEGRRSVRQGYKRILLLWFDEDALGPYASPLKQIARLLCSVPPVPNQQASAKVVGVKVIGPRSSTALKAMVDEVKDRRQDATKDKDWSNGVCQGQIPARFYVSDATVSDAILIPADTASTCPTPDNCLTNYFHRRNIDLYRLIATDEALALAIEGELELRGIDKQGRNSLFTQITQWYPRSIALLRTIGQKWWGKPADKQADTQQAEQARYSHIALVSEWDTLYGRELPDTIERCLGENGTCRPIERCLGENGTCRPGELDQSQRKEWLHTFKYMRGLDGQMPNADGPSSGNGAKDSANKSDKDVKSAAKGTFATKPQDRAEGQSQFDYLHRLGDRIQQLDTELRRKNKDGIAAVGVLGSDLYDKLLVLQALRPLLPNALFVTTDLDALLLHPTAQTVTRNLIVASSFGLQLRPDIQGEIPPFRNSYQTADFLATRVAIHSDDPPAPCWLRRPPLIFEIGSSREFQFATRRKPPEGKAPQEGHDDCAKHPARATEGERDDHAACKNDLRRCEEIQPIAAAMVPPMSKRLSLGFVLGFVLLGSCVALSFRSVKRRIWTSIESLMNDSKGYVWISTCAAATVAGLGLIVFGLRGILHESWPILANWLTEDGQPLSALEGISVWPTVFLRIVILAVCIGLIVHSWKLLNRNMDRIAKDMYLVKTRDDVRAEQANIVRNSSPWIALERCVGYLPPEDDDETESANRRSSTTVFRFWRIYEYRGRLTARMYRVAVAVLAMLLLWGILFLIFDHPRAPTRGDVSVYFYRSITFLLMFATLFLVFFVADTTLLSYQLIKAFRKKSTFWPIEAVKKYGDRLGFKHLDGDRRGLEDRCLDEYIDLIFISKRTKCITNLLYYPFLIIALIVVSRSRLFANFDLSIPDLVTVGIGVLVVVACAVALRLSAEDSRKKACQRLNDQIAAARNLDDRGLLVGQLEMVLRRIEEMRDGALRPPSQQPLVRAMLLPLGSIGGTTFLEYLLMPGFG